MEQTIHVPHTFCMISNKYETKNNQVLPEFVLSKEILSIWLRRADSRPNRNNLFSMRNLGTIPKNFGFVSKTILKRLSFRFWHCYRLLQRKLTPLSVYQYICPFVFDIATDCYKESWHHSLYISTFFQLLQAGWIQIMATAKKVWYFSISLVHDYRVRTGIYRKKIGNKLPNLPLKQSTCIFS